MNKPVNTVSAGVTYNMIVGGVIRALREERQLTQAQLAAALNMPASTLSRIENGSYSCAVEQLAWIARTLKVIPHHVMERIERSVSLAENQGLQVSIAKQDDKAALYLLGAAAIAALVMAAS